MIARSTADAQSFVRDVTTLTETPFVPGIALYLATELTPLWQKTETWLQENNVAPPYWAFAWPGAQALARYIAANPQLVAGKRVLDFAAGGGLAAIAAMRAGAHSADANDIDPLAMAATTLNAAANNVHVTAILGDIVGSRGRWDFIMCGDVCYEAPMVSQLTKWLRECRKAGAYVLLADPGRKYLPKTGLVPVAAYDVPTLLELEDTTIRRTTVFELA